MIVLLRNLLGLVKFIAQSAPYTVGLCASLTNKINEPIGSINTMHTMILHYYYMLQLSDSIVHLNSFSKYLLVR